MIIRHGFSTWNEKNLFTGWVDVPLTESGVAEAHRAALAIADNGFVPDVVFTSVLDRAIKTADIITSDMNIANIETHRSWRLNERHYGALTGLNKKETVDEFGEEQVLLWRRSFDVPPPPMPENSKYNFCNDALYVDVPCTLIPMTECLKDVCARVMPYFEEVIAPRLLADDNVMVVAHGNSLRAIIKELEKVPDDQISSWELPTATPRLYRFASDFSVESASYIEDINEVSARASAVKDQTKKS